MAAAPLAPKSAGEGIIRICRDVLRRLLTCCGFGRGQTGRHLGTGQMNQRILPVTKGNCSQSEGGRERERNTEPGDTAQEESLDG
jgi:hypothetical protein